MIELGIKGRQEEIVTEELTARIVFKVAAYDEKGLIGEGTHERFVIDVAKFQAKTEEKRKSQSCVG